MKLEKILKILGLDEDDSSNDKDINKWFKKLMFI